VPHAPEHLPACLPEHLPAFLPEHVPAFLPEHVPAFLPEHVSAGGTWATYLINQADGYDTPIDNQKYLQVPYW